jgi:4-diphosphocytidyl-2-C-methyl-D-erythritol kinase
MGGFEGGDEGGYWDVDTPPFSMDKQDKNASKHGHRRKSPIERSDAGYSIKAYSKTKELHDTISFVPCECKTFTIEGCDGIPLTSNTIYKAYQALVDFTDDSDITDFFHAHKVVVTKGIPPSADQEGASSDAAAFIHLAKETCNLILNSDELAKIGSAVNPDVAYFIHNPSADI